MTAEAPPRERRSPSRPRRLPMASGGGLLGHAAALQADAIGTLHRLASASEGVMGFRIGGTVAATVSTPAAARDVLIENADDFGRGRRQTRALTPLMGDGLLTSEGELHRRQRRLVLPHFSPRRIPRHAQAVVATAESLAGRWRAGVDVDLVAEMNTLTMDIVSRLLFTASSSDNHALAEAITEAFAWEMHAITSPVALPLWVPVPRNLRARRAMTGIRAWIARFVRERQEAAAAGAEVPEDILGDLLASRYEDGTAMSEELLLDEVLTAWGAAQETSADAQAWTLYLLARHPDVLERVHHEIGTVLGERTVTFEDLPRLPYCLQVFKEAMRLYPPAAVIPRQAVRDTVVGGHRVKAGTMIFLNAYSLHRNPQVFADPERFDPDRFARERERTLPKGAYLPFGTGGNVCPGSHLAMMEGHLLTVVLHQRLAFDLLPQGAEVTPELLVNLRPSPGVRARVVAR
ncbi:cytochrome P450 [Streptomyces zinciresistens K42]|uniref:Cytochrome P450 n=1 Tax=Streptomyces zinciresistens K42 TaxID=700597 RepID=G2GIL5_9ACTN|nr:cytochrome P450 [Streptomyces zinciresistens]EGX56650.1 cytochrome P450 [Streptomyces zinciresistens K42]